MWPIPCYPADVPAECRMPGALCYANAAGSGYSFRPTADVLDRFKFDPTRAWRRSMEPVVRRVMDDVGWQSLVTKDDASGSPIRQRVAIDSAYTLEGADRILIVIVGTQDGARLALRLARKMSGTFIDPETGARSPAPAFDGQPDELWHLPVPAGHSALLLVLRAT